VALAPKNNFIFSFFFSILSKVLKASYIKKKDMNQEKIMAIAEIERVARELEENLQLIEMQIEELTAFNNSLEFLMKSKDKEMLSSIGKMVYIKTAIEDKKRLFIDVGAGVVVKKTPEETIEIVKEQILRLQEARVQISSQLEIYRGKLQEFIEEIRREN